jgi:hypothetical protein
MLRTLDADVRGDPLEVGQRCVGQINQTIPASVVGDADVLFDLCLDGVGNDIAVDGLGHDRFSFVCGGYVPRDVKVRAASSLSLGCSLYFIIPMPLSDGTSDTKMNFVALLRQPGAAVRQRWTIKRKWLFSRSA